MSAPSRPSPVSACPDPRTGPDHSAPVLSAIDTVLGCQYCGGSLGRSPSPDFCSEDCQYAWHEARATPPTVAGFLPDGLAEAVPDAAPARPLRWLGPPPPGTILRPGHEVLDAVCAFVRRFSVFPHKHAAPTLTLWYAHTHAADRFYVTPRLVLDSAEPASGKTRVLEVAQYLVAAPEMTISATPAALFRLVAAGPITILFDEVDTIFTQNGGANEDLRGLLNAGYKRSATIARCVGDAKAMRVQRFPVYAPAALAGIAGAMPATIITRAITIHMHRRRPDEPVDAFHERRVAHQAAPLRQELAAWAERHGAQLGDANPQVPLGVVDRAAEIWEPLLAIADTAGGHWPETARAACTHFTLHTPAHPTSDGVRLLADLREIFTRRQTDRLPTTALLTELHELDEAPWADLGGGKPLDARRLATLLRRYGVKPGPFRDGGAVAKGYQTGGEHGLADAWSRYLPEPPPDIGYIGNRGYSAGQPVTDPSLVTDPSVTSPSAVTALTRHVTAVTDVTAPASPGGPRREHR